MFKILNIQSLSYVSQRPVGGIEKHVRTCVILWSYPLPFQDSPKRFGNVQMWGVWRKEEDKEAPLLPYWPEFLNPSVSVYGSIVKHYKGVLSDAEGKIIKETDNLICRHSLCSGESFILIVTGYHTKDVKSCYSLGRDEAFRRTARQRIRKQCFSPLRKPLSSSRRCASVNSNTFAFPITNNRTGNTNVCFV